jgi:tetratricopeptide (TPR) repeat protein
MLGSRNQEAIDIGREALEMAEQLGLDEVRAHALNNIGTSRAFFGEREGLDDLRRSIEIASAARSMEAFRGFNNLGAAHMTLGDFRGAAGAWAAGWERVERLRGTSNVQWLVFERLAVAYGTGQWDDLMRLGEEFYADENAPYYLSGYLHEFLGRVRLARGDLAGAVDDARAALENGRLAKDPQRLQPALAFSAFTAFYTGRIRECEELLEELLQLDAVRVAVSHVTAPILDKAWLLTALGRADDFLEVSSQVEQPSRWIQAASAFARGDVEQAAEICAEIGVLPQEAYMRLRAAEKLLEEGRRADAEAQLQQALEFYRSVGAVFHIHEAEALMAASA